ncbi:hypothetical protein D3C71_1817340 [compost metagenome]
MIVPDTVCEADIVPLEFRCNVVDPYVAESRPPKGKERFSMYWFSQRCEKTSRRRATETEYDIER